MAEITATTPEVTSRARVITTPPAPLTMKVYAKVDGSVLDVFPVDAREIVATGEYSFEPVVVENIPEAPAVAVEVSEHGADLESMTKVELQAYAKEIGVHITPVMSKAEQIETIRVGVK